MDTEQLALFEPPVIVTVTVARDDYGYVSMRVTTGTGDPEVRTWVAETYAGMTTRESLDVLEERIASVAWAG